MLKPLALASMAAVFIASTVQAETYECNIIQRSWGGLVTEWYTFDLDEKRNRAKVSDSISNFVVGKPVKATLGEAMMVEVDEGAEAETSDGAQTHETHRAIAWSLKKLPDSPRKASFDADLNVDGLWVQISAQYEDGQDAGHGKGECVLK